MLFDNWEENAPEYGSGGGFDWELDYSFDYSFGHGSGWELDCSSDYSFGCSFGYSFDLGCSCVCGSDYGSDCGSDCGSDYSFGRTHVPEQMNSILHESILVDGYSINSVMSNLYALPYPYNFTVFITQ
ncbi:hypothetical protein BDF14DRAFT_1745669 [Spinellus fusiger]|nr:hypothetical protein BDF14DRAFT_1745669 [Spinellus fusiger]